MSTHANSRRVPIGIAGSIRNSGKAGHRILVQDDREASGGYLVTQWWDGSTGPNAHAAFDDWVEDKAAVTSYFSESGWEIAWDQP